MEDEENGQAKRSRGAQPGNTNRLKHGFYSRRFGRMEQADLEAALAGGLRDEIALMRVTIRRVFDCAVAETLDLKAWLQALAVLGAASNRLATLLRTERQLSDRSDDVAAALSEALAEVVKELEAE